MDVSSWIVNQDPVRKVINCQGLCKPGGLPEHDSNLEVINLDFLEELTKKG